MDKQLDAQAASRIDAVEEQVPGLKWISAFALDDAALRMDWLIADTSGWEDQSEDAPRKGWLPAGRVALFAGPGGKGKSRLALQLAVSIVTNGDTPWIKRAEDLRFMSMPDEAAPLVAYVSWEDSLPEVARRLRALNAWDAAAGRLHFADVAAYGPLWTGNQLTELGTLIRHKCEALKTARLLIIDPLAAAYGDNENDRAAVRRFIADWDAWGREKGCAVLLVAHPPKSESLYSGSTDWHGAARTVWALRDVKEPGKKAEEADSQLALTCIKSNYGLLPPRVWLRQEENGVIVKATNPTWWTKKEAIKAGEASENPMKGVS